MMKERGSEKLRWQLRGLIMSAVLAVGCQLHTATAWIATVAFGLESSLTTPYIHNVFT